MISARLKINLTRLIFGGVLILLFLPLIMYFSHDVEQLNRYYPNKVIQNDLSIHYEIKSERPKDWVDLKAISPFVQWAIILSEDWSFYHHGGIDVQQIETAFREMFTLAKFRGASTITQQMIKNVYLSEKRTIWRKVHELILAQKVEKVLSKKKILEIYLNCIEYGPGIYGIRNASNHYFKKHPSEVSPREAAFLAMLLPSPKRYYVSFKRKKLTFFARARINTILKKMKMAKIISNDEFLRQKRLKLSWEKY